MLSYKDTPIQADFFPNMPGMVPRELRRYEKDIVEYMTNIEAKTPIYNNLPAAIETDFGQKFAQDLMNTSEKSMEEIFSGKALDSMARKLPSMEAVSTLFTSGGPATTYRLHENSILMSIPRNPIETLKQLISRTTDTKVKGHLESQLNYLQKSQEHLKNQANESVHILFGLPTKEDSSLPIKGLYIENKQNSTTMSLTTYLKENKFFYKKTPFGQSPFIGGNAAGEIFSTKQISSTVVHEATHMGTVAKNGWKHTTAERNTYNFFKKGHWMLTTFNISLLAAAYFTNPWLAIVPIVTYGTHALYGYALSRNPNNTVGKVHHDMLALELDARKAESAFNSRLIGAGFQPDSAFDNDQFLFRYQNRAWWFIDKIRIASRKSQKPIIKPATA